MSTNVNYVNYLENTTKTVLRADRDAGNSPELAISKDDCNRVISFKFFNDLIIENMKSDPSQGKKRRIDIHFTNEQTIALYKYFQTNVEALNISEKIHYTSTTNPTGREWSRGKPLARTNKSLTNFNCIVEIGKSESKEIMRFNTKLYIDAEIYNFKGRKFHLGASLDDPIIEDFNENQNTVIIKLNYDYIPKFLESIKIAIDFFKGYSDE